MMAGISCQGCYGEWHVRERRGGPKCLHLGLIEHHPSKPQIDALSHTNEASMSVRFLKKIKWNNTNYIIWLKSCEIVKLT